MLNSDQKLIADALGYEPISDVERKQQFSIEENFENNGKNVPFNGAIAKIDNVLSIYWMPQGSNYKEEYDDLVGWYEIPTNDEIETWVFDSVVPTPAEDEVEPDHPDSWLSLLGMI